MIPALLASIFNAIEGVGEKHTIDYKTMDYKAFADLSFFYIVMALLPFALFYGEIDRGAWELFPLIVLIISSSIAASRNLMYYYATEGDALANLEPIVLSQPIFAILIASALFPDERELGIIIPALIGGVVLLLTFSKWENKRLKLEINKYSIAMFGSVFLMAANASNYKFLLEFYSPLTLYFVRCLLVFGILYLIFHPVFKGKIIQKEELFFEAVLAILANVLLYTAYQQIGVVYTSMILLTSPVFVFFMSWLFLKEKLEKKKLIGSALILACVFIAYLGQLS